jgi:hypothetical protein
MIDEDGGGALGRLLGAISSCQEATQTELPIDNHQDAELVFYWRVPQLPQDGQISAVQKMIATDWNTERVLFPWTSGRVTSSGP